MKVRVLRGPTGEILATFERPPNALVSFEPEVEEDARVEEVEASDDYARDVLSLYNSHGERRSSDEAS
jgi:hypothetical protein